jgi:hypothetical protein
MTGICALLHFSWLKLNFSNRRMSRAGFFEECAYAENPSNPDYRGSSSPKMQRHQGGLGIGVNFFHLTCSASDIH